MLIGRYKEQKMLLSLLDSQESEFVAVYGRRRVGKTFFKRKIQRQLTMDDLFNW